MKYLGELKAVWAGMAPGELMILKLAADFCSAA